MITDLREYTDAELSLHVMNDEDLYRDAQRAAGIPSRMRALRAALTEVFLFTDEQWDDLVETLDEDAADNTANN